MVWFAVELVVDGIGGCSLGLFLPDNQGGVAGVHNHALVYTTATA